MPYTDISGKRFGRYTVLCYAGNNKHGCALWKCKCDCGTIKTVLGSSLRRGLIVSCGCYHRDQLTERLTTHGQTKTRLCNIWRSMKSRCNNPHNKHYSYYGGKGIKICSEWENDFISFSKWAYSNGYSDNLTIDRINPDKGYEPSNCRWITRTEQQLHLSNCRIYEINGVRLPLNTWCKIYKRPHETIRKRLSKGWDIKKALTTPSDMRYSHKKRTISGCSELPAD